MEHKQRQTHRRPRSLSLCAMLLLLLRLTAMPLVCTHMKRPVRCCKRRGAANGVIGAESNN
jgi:hypothetical protein